MKRLLIIGVIASFATAEAAAATWVAGRDLRINELSGTELSNPNGVVPAWSYGSYNPVTGIFTLFTPASHLNLPSGLQGYHPPLIVVNTLTTPLVENYDTGPLAAIEPDEIAMHPTESGVRPNVRWTAPNAGSYRIDFYFEDANPYGGDGGSGHVALNGSEIYAQEWNNGGGAMSFFDLVLNTGDVIDFALGMRNNWAYDTTRFDATISSVPVPASLYLLTPVIGAIGIARRRPPRVEPATPTGSVRAFHLADGAAELHRSRPIRSLMLVDRSDRHSCKEHKKR